MEKKMPKNYTEAISRLEEIVNKIEKDNPDVDLLTSLVDEAVSLSQYCKKKLTETDKQLEELIAKLDADEQ